MICSSSHYLQSLAREVVSKLASEALPLSFRKGRKLEHGIPTGLVCSCYNHDTNEIF